MAIDMMTALGGSATVMGYSDIYTGMQQGKLWMALRTMLPLCDHKDVLNQVLLLR